MKQIAVVFEIEWPINRHYQVYAGIQAYASTQPDWTLVLDGVPEAVLSGSWPGERYDALIGRIQPDCLRAAREAGIPVVNTWLNSPIADQVHSVLPDLAETARVAVAHFAERGVRHLAHVGMRSDKSRVMQTESMQATAAELGMSFSAHICGDHRHHELNTWQEFCNQLKEWATAWQAADRLPIGVLGADDLLAREMAAVLPRFGMTTPDQIAIVGSGNSLVLCTSTVPEISSIDLDYFQNGYRAARLLDDLLTGKKIPKTQQLIQPKELYVRRSSDVYAVNDPDVADALQFMADNYDSPLSVELIAKHIRLGRRTLERRFRSVVGDSIANKLSQMRVEAVKRLLLDTDDPLKSIYADAGFGSEKQMRVAFRKFTGMTPNAFRANASE